MIRPTQLEFPSLHKVEEPKLHERVNNRCFTIAALKVARGQDKRKRVALSLFMLNRSASEVSP